MRFTKTIASAAVAGVLGLAGVSVAGAAATGPSQPAAAPTTTTTGPASTPTTTPGAGSAARFARRRHLRRRLAVLSARAIGIKPRVLVRELRGGKTIAQVATEHGIQPQAVIDALETAVNTRIEAAQAANKITAQRAAKLKLRFAASIPKFVDDWHPRPKPAG